MPGRGKPFVSGDPRHRPGPGRPKLEYLEAMQSLAPEAVDVLTQGLAKQGPPRVFARFAVGATTVMVMPLVSKPLPPERETWYGPSGPNRSSIRSVESA